MSTILYGFEELIYFHSKIFCYTSANFERLKKNWNNSTVDFIVLAFVRLSKIGIFSQ